MCVVIRIYLCEPLKVVTEIYILKLRSVTPFLFLFIQKTNINFFIKAGFEAQTKLPVNKLPKM